MMRDEADNRGKGPRRMREKKRCIKRDKSTIKEG